LGKAQNQDNKLGFILNSSCCPSLFDENIKVIPKRRNIRKARRNRRKKSIFFFSSLSFQERVRVRVQTWHMVNKINRGHR